MADEGSPKGTLNATDYKKLGVHAGIFVLATVLTPVVEALLNGLLSQDIEFGKYTVIIQGALVGILQLLRLLNNGPPSGTDPSGEAVDQ